jgi:hypothetical protein
MLASSTASSPSDFVSTPSTSSSMPADRSRVNNPQGRQKACSECAKAKRRCDLRQPSCVRCSRQKLSCTYPPQPSSNASPASHEDTILPDSLEIHNGFPYDTQNISHDQDVGLLDFDPTIGMDSASALNDLIAQDVEASYTLVRPSYVPGKELSPSQLSSFSRSRVEYCVDQWKSTPAMMVSENCTHWSHPLLYEEHMPRSLQGQSHSSRIQHRLTSCRCLCSLRALCCEE